MQQGMARPPPSPSAASAPVISAAQGAVPRPRRSTPTCQSSAARGRAAPLQRRAAPPSPGQGGMGPDPTVSAVGGLTGPGPGSGYPARRRSTAGYPTPHTEEILHRLQGYHVYSVIDRKDAYNQVNLHPDSRDLTTCQVIKSCYFCHTRCPFGLALSGTASQKIMCEMIKGVKRVEKYSDGIAVQAPLARSMTDVCLRCLLFFAINK